MSWSRRPHRLLLAGALAASALGAAAASGIASAGAPGVWTRISEPTGAKADEVALARTSDGVLHVAWLREHGDRVDLMHTAIARNGRVAGSPTPIVRGWESIGNPALVASPEGDLRVVFGGIRSSAAGEKNKASLYTATSGEEGAAWTLVNGPIAKSTNAYVSPAATTLERDGTLVTAWAKVGGLGGLVVHVGLDPAAADQTVRTGCCVRQPQLATDASSGQVVLGWYSVTGYLVAQAVAPNGPLRPAPGSASNTDADKQRTAIGARIGAPGVYLAYCGGASILSSCRVELWRYGGGKPLLVAKAPDAGNVGIGPGPQGRLWVTWAQPGSHRIFAARTNRAVTRVGPPVSTPTPRKNSFLWKLDGDGTNGPLDLLASVATGSGQAIATWHTQLLPPLTLTAKLRKLGTKLRLVLTVADAGDPVPGAMIRVTGKVPQGLAVPKPGRSDAHGRVTLTLSPVQGMLHGPLTLAATKAGYGPAKVKVMPSP